MQMLMPLMCSQTDTHLIVGVIESAIDYTLWYCNGVLAMSWVIGNGQGTENGVENGPSVVEVVEEK
jgi:hypothetical protein